MTRLIDLVVGVYGLGLIAYLLLSWMLSTPSIGNVQMDKAKAWLGRFYDPVLGKIRAVVKPMRVGNAFLDVAPGVLLLGLLVLKRVVVCLMPVGM